MECIADRLEKVNERIESACRAAGRTRDAVQLIAVSKTHGPEAVTEAVEAGVTVFGENRVQEAVAKIPRCPPRASWHLIGHLQRNKARLAVQYFSMIHSVDSLRLLEAVDRLCHESGRTLPVCLQVNVSGEPSKEGMSPEELPAVLEASFQLVHVDVIGLMTIPPFSPDPEKARPCFAALRALRDRQQETLGAHLPELSMGMSLDLEVAVEEGATMVRVGTDIFGKRGSVWT